MTNHFLASASFSSGEDVASLNDAAVTTGTSTNASAVMEFRWSDTATGASNYVVCRRDIVDFLKRLIVFVNSDGAISGGGTDLPIN